MRLQTKEFIYKRLHNKNLKYRQHIHFKHDWGYQSTKMTSLVLTKIYAIGIGKNKESWQIDLLVCYSREDFIISNSLCALATNGTNLEISLSTFVTKTVYVSHILQAMLHSRVLIHGIHFETDNSKMLYLPNFPRIVSFPSVLPQSASRPHLDWELVSTCVNKNLIHCLEFLKL